MSSPVTADEVAQWMYDEFTASGELFQVDAADGILARFGTAFIYENENGNPAIDKTVLKAFRDLTESTAVWDRTVLCWRRREPSDPPGKRQAE